MKRFLPNVVAVALAAIIAVPSLSAETVTLKGKEYNVDRLIDRQIAPGVQYTRFRVPAYPLNINVLTVDMTNPYNRIETTVANESAKGTELLTSAAKRQSREGHRAVAGANANFWVVATQKEYPAYSGTTRNVSLRNGKLVTESNQFNDIWDGGTMRTGTVGISTDKKVYVDKCTSEIKIKNDKIGELDVMQCNKGVHPNELCMYNSFYGTSKAFMPISDSWVEEDLKDATEILLDMNEGSEWSGGNDMFFTVKEIRTNAGRGTLGKHDLALVARGEWVAATAALAVGDQITMHYNWTYRPKSEKNKVTPILENAVGGNAIVMIDGKLTDYNTNENYNAQVYSRTGYGRSADRNTLFICVIDKSTDPVYGQSAGCPTSVMCEFMQSLGCTDMINFDAGGSAEMFVNGKIINTTTESNPRSVANGFLIYSIAPEDDNSVASLAFDEISLKAPVYGSFEPKVIAYNKYGYPVDYNLKGFTLSCAPELGSCEGSVFTAGGTPMTGELTAEYNGATVKGTIEVLDAQMSIRIKPAIIIDNFREYPMETQATIGSQVYSYNPESVNWSVEDENIATIDGQGVLHGQNEGITTITAKIGEFSDQTNVNVQIPDHARYMLNDWTNDWTVKGASGMNNAKIAEDGTISYSYASPRDAYIQLLKDIDFYSLPDRAIITFSSTLPVNTLMADIRSANQDRPSPLKVTQANGTETFDANTEYTVELPLSELGDLKDLALYPISLHYLKFTTARSSDYRGEQSIKISDLYTEYDHFTSSIENVSVDRDNFEIAGETVYYNLQGIRVSADSLTPGVYVKVAGTKVVKVMVK